MSIAPKLRQFLNAERADYDVIEHPPTRSSMQSAQMSHVPAERLAKAVLLDANGDYLLAVLPANHRIQLSELRTELGQKPRLAAERDIDRVFPDCALGAVPPLGTGYGVATIIDNRLDDQSDIYFEAGDHQSLIHMSRDEFSRLTPEARHGRFSEQSSWRD